MRTYRVHYRQFPVDETAEIIDSTFEFQADDSDHALEQAEDHLENDSWDYEILSVYVN